jgi:transcriptional antiterminator RfaH
MGLETFMPQHMVERRVRGCLRAERRPVFAGYVFVSPGRARPDWRRIRSTPGVSQLVGFGQAGPALVPNALVAELMQRCDAAGVLQPDQDFVEGDRVRVTRGPFADFVSTIEKIDSERRIHLLLDLLGGKTRVSLDPDRVVRQA